MSNRDDNARIDLIELGNARRWDSMIVIANKIMASNAARMMSAYERGFIDDMIFRDKNDRPLWSPTRKQYNLLRHITMGDV